MVCLLTEGCTRDAGDRRPIVLLSAVYRVWATTRCGELSNSCITLPSLVRTNAGKRAHLVRLAARQRFAERVPQTVAICARVHQLQIGRPDASAPLVVARRTRLGQVTAVARWCSCWCASGLRATLLSTSGCCGWSQHRGCRGAGLGPGSCQALWSMDLGENTLCAVRWHDFKEG